jgi:prolyl oligopeptidase
MTEEEKPQGSCANFFHEMKKYFVRAPFASVGRCLGAAVLLAVLFPLPGLAAALRTPITRSEPAVDVFHGVAVSDPYRWLEEQDSTEVRWWIEQQTHYADAFLAPLPGREDMKRRITDLLRTDSVGIPVQRAGRLFFLRRPADRDRSALFLREGLAGSDRLLIDPEKLGEKVSVSLLDVSADGRRLAYGVREGGEDEVRVRFLEVDGGRDLPDELPRARYSGVSLLPDGRGVYFARQGGEGGRVFFRALEGGGRDEEVFGDGSAPDRIVHCNLSDDGRYLTITVLHGSAARRTEVYVRNLATRGPLRTVVKDLEAAFFAGMAGDRLILQTTWQAPNGRIFTADPERPGRSTWKEIVPERKNASIHSVRAVGGRIFVNYLEDVRSRVEAFRLDGTPAGEIPFDTLGTVTNVSGTWDSRQAFFLFTSFHVPGTIYAYDVETGARQMWFRHTAPIDSDRYQVEQVWFPSRDGTRVPMFIVHRKGLRRDGTHPTLLLGYGGFGVSLTPFYAPMPAAWLQSGGVYAVALVRGGGELGDAWHQAGMLTRKQNTFDDFIAAAEWLIRERYTQPSRLAATGSSNGALTVGAAITQRPDLFRAAVCSYPVLDMIRFPRFLMGKLWTSEYGAPEDPEQFRALYAYSPYHRIEPGRKYPAVLLISGDGDTRVTPMHARKMTAALQKESSLERPVFLRYHTDSGHAAGQTVSDQIEDTTDTLSFLHWQLGVPPGGIQDEAAGSVSIVPYTFRARSGAVEAELGELTVPESRRSPSGRTIRLAFVRFPSTAETPGPPIVFLAGGPGGSGIEAAGGPLFPLFMALRAAGDVIALDQRGTGLSRPELPCREAWLLPYDRPATEEDVVGAAIEHSRSCAAALRAGGIDLDAYNVQESADDLEDLRRALGAPKLSLWGTSYGSQLALTAIRRHEASLDRIVLAGVLGPDQTLRSPREVQAQLAEVGRLAQADPQMGAAVPDLLELMRRVLGRLEREPVTARVDDPIGKAAVEIRLGPFDLRWMTAERLGSRDGIRSLPSLYLAMDRGDFSALARFAFRNRKGWLGSAVPYVTQCASVSSDERLARIRSEEAGALLGSVSNLPFPGICRGWEISPLAPELRSPVVSRLPALLISGSLDGRTPPADAEEVRRGLPNGVHLILEGAVHGNDLLVSSPGIARTILDFLRGAEVRPDRIPLPPLTFDAGASREGV